MKLSELRKDLKTQFSQQDIDSGDVDYIISEVLCIPSTQILLIENIDEKEVEEIKKYAEMRLNHKPVQKIFKKAYFFGYEFKINNDVLCPRPETEILVETALKYIKDNKYFRILDLCTGSGCIAISIKKNADVEMVASDVSEKALKIAKENAKLNNVEIEFINSDMFENISGGFDLIVSNPPYIDSKEVEMLDVEVKNFDPKLALDGGDLGLRFYNIIHNNLKKYLNDNGMAIFEIGEDQKDMLQGLFNNFDVVECLKDYSNNDRILIVKNN